jgi:preprotein translocase subunit SecE
VVVIVLVLMVAVYLWVVDTALSTLIRTLLK